MEIKKINNEEKEKYMDLILEADPDKEVVKKYINNGDMYGIFENEKCVCEIIITKVDKDTCELKNISTDINFRGKGSLVKL